MTKHLLSLALLAMTAAPALAFDPAAMTEAERAAFGTEVRAYLMANPQVIMEAVAQMEARQQADASAADTALVQANSKTIFEDGASWVGGNPDGDVTLVEFMDYRCGYCKKANPEVEELVKSDGNIRFVIKEFPILGEESILASRFAVAVRQVAGDADYKAIHDALIGLRADVTPDALAALATAQGLDGAAVMARMDAPEVQAVIDANHALGTTLGINGTPTFVIGGQMVRGYVPLDGMREIVAAERAAD